MCENITVGVNSNGATVLTTLSNNRTVKDEVITCWCSNCSVEFSITWVDKDSQLSIFTVTGITTTSCNSENVVPWTCKFSIEI